MEETQAESGEATSVGAVVSKFDQVKAVADRAVEEYGRLDSWVHLAAVGLFATSQQTTPGEFERVIDVNLMGQVYGAMAALPHIKLEGRGGLIHISSVEAKRSFPFHSAYGASKHGIDRFLKALRLGGPARRAQARGMADKREPGDARYHKHALLRQGAHQARRQACYPTAHLQTQHRNGRGPARRREPGARSRGGGPHGQ